MKELIDMYKEPSSWSGIGLIATSVFGASAGQMEIITSAIIGVLGVISMFLPEEERKQKRRAAKG